MIIYHITSPEAWSACAGRPSYRAASLETEGFIHCSYPQQLGKVIERYFRGKGRIAILSIDTEKLRSKLVEEPSTAGEMYPHLYGRLNVNAVVAVEEREV